jgi:hypothetical protein
MFVVNHNFKISPSARCVSVANPICKDIDIFEKDFITLNESDLGYCSVATCLSTDSTSSIRPSHFA